MMVHLTPLFFSLWTDNLLIDYQFTFSLIQEDDNHYTAINFMASPEQVNISYCTRVAAILLNEFVDKILKQNFYNFFASLMCLFCNVINVVFVFCSDHPEG